MAEAEPIALVWAYRQWVFARRLLRRMINGAAEPNRNMDPRMWQEAEMVFGRWLQTMQLYSRGQLSGRFPLFPREPFGDHESKAELKRMLERHLEMNAGQAEESANAMLAMVEEFLGQNEESNAGADIEVRFDGDHAHPQNGGQLLVADFRTRRCPRVSCLVDHYGVRETALVCLRYEPLNYYIGGESGMSVRALNTLHDIGCATHEGFASPLNCRLLGRPDIKFCSLFADSDSAFGSLGNFFSVKLRDYPGGWILNPPFVEPVMVETANRVLDLLEVAEPGSFWFYITFPIWEDNEGWLKIDQSRWTNARINFRMGTFLQQDLYGEIFRPRVPLCIFVVGKPPGSVDLMRLRDELSDNADEATVRADWLEACDIAE